MIAVLDVWLGVWDGTRTSRPNILVAMTGDRTFAEIRTCTWASADQFGGDEAKGQRELYYPDRIATR